MKKKTKILTIILVLLFGVLVVGANVWRSHAGVKGIRVNIDYAGADTLVTPKQVAQQVLVGIPGLKTSKLGDVDLKKVETIAAQSPYLQDCEAATSIGGKVVLYAVQRRPIVRVFTSKAEFYLDTAGHQLPISVVGSSDVIVASGAISPKGKSLPQVLALAKFLDQHPDISPLFDQIYYDQQGSLFLTPKLGSHEVEVGTADNLEEKFNNLLALYSRGLPHTGWDTYSKISIKYKGQVVCTRKVSSD